MTASVLPSPVQNIVDRQQIADVLNRYCRGIDRCDIDTLKSAYWPDATDDHGSGPVPAKEFAERVIPALKAMICTMHSISNTVIDLRDNQARVETYCTAYHQFSGEDGPAEMVVGGRYLDRMAKRNGEWRIAERVFVMDWNRNTPSSQELEEGLYATLQVRGARFPEDPSDRFMQG